MQVPYSKMDLRIAGLSLNRKLDAYITKHGEGGLLKRMEAIAAEYATPESPAALNKLVAELNGVSVEALVASPNMMALITSYAEDRALMVKDAVKAAFDLEEKEAWAFVLAREMGGA